MKIKNKIKKVVSFLLHGEQKPIYANISYLTPNNRLSGKKIIVTGGSRGLGFSMAQKFVSEGADVLITGRDENSLKQSALQINCKYLVLDAQDLDSFKSFFATAAKFYLVVLIAWLITLAFHCMNRISSMLQKKVSINR